MRLLITIILFSLVITGCKKEKTDPPPVTVTPPEMLYTPLNNTTVGFKQVEKLDINHDGTDDFRFGTIHIGDPILKQDKVQYVIVSSTTAMLLVNNDDSSIVMKKNDIIPIKALPGFDWFEVSWLTLGQKVIEENGNVFWVGFWANSSHKYLPVQVNKNDKRYNGWIEISMDTQNEKIILHNAAISKEAERDVKAGV